jgi:cytoskeletal protein CcmA (bactofilin family)
MTDAPRRRLLDRLTANPTFIGAGTVFTGELKAEGDLVVAGAVVGDGVVRGTLTVAADGRWEGNVHSNHAVIAGTVEGIVHAAERLEVRKSARILGAVRARSLAIAAGATIDGETTVTSGAPVKEFEEKRRP